ncbi:GNAT family N-acetyltransferase [Dolichospermum sp. UHCC 0259]|uniref:GNAT family N-acetyltransferase n=1 Tax=Dolichospermum sp. UHCC 0259 TaxID=2590010 RepID=UPI001445AAC1|nr:GNAT family N-acetyltransferase [Dolichospermum sp. UHCC 0259]MTJ47666.1 GNAT family N-acetyltransferase [Dolichospermum sp. UHCC 0259]
MIVREYQISDTEAIMKLFYDTVHHINIHDYTQEQVNAWTGENMNYEFWHQRLQSKQPFIAENHGEIVGFAELEANGHIDCFYCHSQYQRQGIGSKLLTHIENTAKSREIHRLYAEVSITAKPFFQHWEFTIVREQEVERRGIKFKNYVMEKYL